MDIQIYRLNVVLFSLMMNFIILDFKVSNRNSNVRFFFKIYLFFRQRGREGERESSKCGCLSSAPYWEPGPQPRRVS